jgi:hypothetical protein
VQLSFGGGGASCVGQQDRRISLQRQNLNGQRGAGVEGGGVAGQIEFQCVAVEKIIQNEVLADADAGDVASVMQAQQRGRG